MRLAVFVSGSGTNLQAIIDRAHGQGGVEVSLVLSDRADAGGLSRAAAADIPSIVLSNHQNGTAIVTTLQTHHIDLVVLAGYLRLIPTEVVHAFDNRMINIHPALLPAFGGKGMYGRRVHEAVLDSGARVSGPTIHLVTSEFDKGLILAQWPVPVHGDDTPDTLAARVLATEHKLLPAVLLSIAREGLGQFAFGFSRFVSDSPTDFLSDVS